MTTIRLNRLTIILLIVTGACMMTSCKSGDNDNIYEINTYTHEKYGKIRVVYLKRSGVIQSWPCKHGKIRFYENGKLLSFTMSEDYLKNNDTIPGGSRLTLFQNGNPEYIRLASDTKIQGHQVASNTRFSDKLTRFYGEGSLKQFTAVSDTVIDGIPVSNKSEIILYPDGQLMICQLNQDLTVGNKSFLPGTKVVIIENRRIYEYTSDIHLSIESQMNMGTYTTEKVKQAYELRMNGRINQANNIIEAMEKDYDLGSPLALYEMGRIKRHKHLGDPAKEWAGTALKYTGWASGWDRHSILFCYFDADCQSFTGYRHWMRGDTLHARGLYQRAIGQFETVLRMKPDYYPARLSLVDLYARLPVFLGGDRKKAEMHARELKNEDPIWGARAEAILLPDEETRMEYWMNTTESFRDNPDILYELGRAYLMNDDIMNGDKSFRKAMELDSTKIILLTDLASYHMNKLQKNTGDPVKHREAAQAYIYEYLETEPIQPLQAWCYGKLAEMEKYSGELNEADKNYAIAKKLDPMYLKENRLPPMILYNKPGELPDEYYSYLDTY